MNRLGEIALALAGTVAGLALILISADVISDGALSSVISAKETVDESATAE